MVNLSRKQLFIVAGGVVAVAVVLILVFSNIRRLSGGGEEFNVVFAGLDPPSVWEGIIKEYGGFRPQVKVKYALLDPQNYREEIISALASGRGPDIFYIGNRDLLMEAGKVAPVDPRQFDASSLRELYPGVVEGDFVLGGRVGALPLYLDTMAVIYNRSIFDQAGIATVPKTWEEFLKIVPLLREFGAGRQITRAAAAIGGSDKSVDAGVDLLTLLMLQNGAQMNNAEKKAATFAGLNVNGLRAFDFYLQFANAASPYFTWTDAQQNSVDAFAQGKAAAIFNYPSSIEKIKSISPFLDIGIAPMLQVSASGSAVNYARYHGLAVARQSRSPGAAWDFVIYATTRESAAKAYAAATGRIPALRSLLGEKSASAARDVFMKQALTARSWAPPSSVEASNILSRAIESVLRGQVTSEVALRQAEGQINQLYPK